MDILKVHVLRRRCNQLYARAIKFAAVLMVIHTRESVLLAKFTVCQ